MNRTPIVLGGMLIALLALSGCDTITDLMGGGGGAEAFAEGEALLRQGDLPAAADRWEEAQVTNPGDVDAATGAAFSLLLKGDTEAADAALAAAEGKAGERLSELKMRRALVALEAGDLDQVRSHAIASGLPAGKLLAAEVAMADGETDEALELLEEASGSGGSVGRLASDYMARLSDEDSMVSGLCEAEALWALGVRKVAVKSADELVRGLPEDREDKPALLLTWAGRAVSVQEAEIAQGLLDPLTFPPEGLKWRMDAVQAMVYCVQGDIETCQSSFEKLDRTGPATGVADARATAAYLIAEENPEAAKALVGSLQSNAAARALLATGDGTAAQNASPGGVIDNYLASGG
jgi:tetratricopeptide (TPR) repeat protein